MQYRSLYSLVGIAVITLVALIIAVSGTGLFTLHLGRPVTVQLGLDLQGGARILLQAVPAPGQALDDETMEATRRIIESRVNGGLGVTEPVIQTVKSGDKRFISVELPGLKKNLQNVESVLQKTGQLTLVALDATPLPRGAPTHGHRVLARGTDIDGKKVAVGTDAVGAPAVDVTVRGPAAARIAEYTAAHVGGYMGIALDNRIYDSPQIQSPLGGQFQITNVGSLDNAKNLAITLKYGALPVPLQVAGVQEVSATLGPDNVRASILAGIVGLLIVMLFMALHYGVPGLLADAALLIYALVVFALFKLLPVTLTLAGIAGFILSIGMAVDAN
ncbi:MAG TPA: protein translocase subunit SecD, partial [Chloroflexota bacterium]|nr:protein translocase subunit SecD [Chloroflexota bacterium]